MPGGIGKPGDFGVDVPPEEIIAAYLPYKDKSILPDAGGWLDQRPGIARGLQLMDTWVAWWMEFYETKEARDAYDSNPVDLDSV